MKDYIGLTILGYGMFILYGLNAVLAYLHQDYEWLLLWACLTAVLGMLSTYFNQKNNSMIERLFKLLKLYKNKK